MAERPRLKAFKKEMAQSMAGMLDMPPAAINIKAGTNEGCDAIGRGEAIAAHAVLLLTAVP
jgi:2-C-methyl-D-erythritol 2,4-cyclodiphosphate synthase